MPVILTDDILPEAKRTAIARRFQNFKLMVCEVVYKPLYLYPPGATKPSLVVENGFVFNTGKVQQDASKAFLWIEILDPSAYKNAEIMPNKTGGPILYFGIKPTTQKTIWAKVPFLDIGEEFTATNQYDFVKQKSKLVYLTCILYTYADFLKKKTDKNKTNPTPTPKKGDAPIYANPDKYANSLPDDFKKFAAWALGWEGGENLNNLKNDLGGYTNKGVTIKTWGNLAPKLFGIPGTATTLKNITSAQAMLIMYEFWKIATYNGAIADKVVQYLITEWFWGSGYDGLKSWQEMLNTKFGASLTVDGIVGPKTVAATNAVPAKKILSVAKPWRIAFLEKIVKDNPGQKVNLNGWKNRVNDFYDKWGGAIAGGGLLVLLAVGYLILKNG